MRRILTLMSMMMLSATLSFGQARVVTGRVTDATGAPVSGASVTVVGTNQGTSTDANGNFRISVPVNGSIEVSGVGYTLQRLNTQSLSSLNVSLAPSAGSDLTTVVVTALAIQRQKPSLGYATSTVRTAELTAAKPTNLQNGLTGKVSGLNMSTTNSGVTADTRITLRGIRSLTGNNQPMLIVDGVPTPLSFLSSINPNDIASVDVMKSNTSTAIYGPDGVNGAIIVTTKKGSSRPVVTLSHTFQAEQVSYMPKFQSRWGSGYDQNPYTGMGTYTPYEQQSWGDEFDGTMRDFGEAGPDSTLPLRQLRYANLPNNRKDFFDVGLTNQTDVSYSASGFYFSAQNVDVKGTMPGDKRTRRSITFRAEKEINRFKAILNARYTQGKVDVTTRNREVYYGITSVPAQVPISQYADWRNDYWSSPNGFFTPYLTNFLFTPYFAKDNFRNNYTNDDLMGSVELNYKLSDAVKFIYRLGLNQNNTNGRSFNGAWSFDSYYTHRPSGPSARQISAAVNDYMGQLYRLNSEIFGVVEKKYNDFGFNATLGYSYRNQKSKNVGVGSANLGQSQFLSIVNRLGEPVPSISNSAYVLQRAFGLLGLSYRNFLFLEATGSYDTDSRLVPGNNNWEMKDISFFYPGASASLLLHELMPSVRNGNVISFLKLRGAIAKTGNVNMSPYQNATAFGAATFFPFGTTQGFQIGSSVYPVAGLKPEFVNTKEVGMEIGLWKNRVNLEGSYYIQKNTDQILNVQISNTTGATTAVMNAADFTNRGYELDLKLTPLVKLGAVNVDFKINYAHQKNKVNALADGVPELGLGNANYAIVGLPAFVFKLTDYIRDSATGKVIVDRTTGMPTLNSNLTTFGQTLPEHILGLNAGLSWKNLRLNIVAEYRGGNFMLADELGAYMDGNGISERSGYFGRRAFIFPNSVYDDGTGKYVNNTDVYTSQYGRLFFNTSLNEDVETNYYADASFWKLREVTLSYDFPSTMFTNSKLFKGASVSVFGRNLLMWVPKSNQWTDPEFQGGNGNSAYTGNATGRSTLYNMPPTRFMGINLTAQF